MATQVEKLMPASGKTSEDYLSYSRELLNVSNANVFVRAILSSLLLFGILWVFKLPGLSDIKAFSAVTTLFLERSLIQYITTFTFFAGFWFLILKLPRISHEAHGFDLLNFPELRQFPLGAEAAAKVSQKIRGLGTEQRQLAVIRRVETAFQRLVHTRDTAEVHDVLNTMSDIDREIVETSYRSVRFAVWFIPVAGFLGTVLGISRAISGFSSIINTKANISLQSMKPILADSTYSLGVAFDTTLLALLLSSILVLTMYYVQRKEEVFLSALDEYCVSEIVNKLYIPDPGTTQILEGLEQLTSRLAQSIVDMSEAMRSDLGRLANSFEGRDEKQSQRLIETMQKRFDQFMDKREQNENAGRKEMESLMAQLTALTDKGKAIEGIVDGFGNLTNLESILINNQEALVNLKKALNQQQEQTRESLEQNQKAFENLLPPLRELASGIKIKIGE